MTKKFEQDIIKKRPEPLKKLDQVYMGYNSLVRTCSYLKKFVKYKNVLLVGDDDLISLHFSKYCAPKNVTVLDIDLRILKHIETNARNYGLNVDVLKYNVLSALPKKLLESCDFFYTNPPYGKNNLGDSCKAFILRGIESIRVGGYGAFIIASNSVSGWARVAKERTFKFVKECGCEIVDKQENFQKYINNDIISSLYIIRKNENLKVLNDFLKGINLYD